MKAWIAGMSRRKGVEGTAPEQSFPNSGNSEKNKVATSEVRDGNALIGSDTGQKDEVIGGARSSIMQSLITHG